MLLPLPRILCPIAMLVILFALPDLFSTFLSVLCPERPGYWLLQTIPCGTHCPLSSYWIRPMESTGSRLEGRRKERLRYLFCPSPSHQPYKRTVSYSSYRILVIASSPYPFSLWDSNSFYYCQSLDALLPLTILLNLYSIVYFKNSLQLSFWIFHLFPAENDLANLYNLDYPSLTFKVTQGLCYQKSSELGFRISCFHRSLLKLLSYTYHSEFLTVMIK